MRHLALFLWTLLSALPALAATEIITLGYRTADELLDVADSVIGDRGRVSASGNHLVVNAPASVISELRAVISQIDQPPRRLLITLDTQDSAGAAYQGLGIADSPRTGVRIIQHRTDRQGNGLQQIQTTEGFPALIQVGQRVPFDQTAIDAHGRPYRQTGLEDVMRGFFVTAQVIGEHVRVTLNSRRDALNQTDRDSIDTQRAATHLTGRLGEWIEVGGVAEQYSADDRSLHRLYSTEGEQDVRLRLRVDVLE